MTFPDTSASQREAEGDRQQEGGPSVEDLKLLWQGLPEGKSVARAHRIVWFILVILGITAFLAILWTDNPIWQTILFEVLGVVGWFVGAAFVIAMFENIYADPKFNNFQIRVQRDQLLQNYQVDPSASLELRDLWILNQKRLDLYHQIATNQAKSSFRWAQFAAIVGFLILVGAAITVWFSDSNTTAITTGTIGVFGGSLGAFIGNTFMNVQRGAADQLRQYFNHPLELSKILIAERLLEGLPPEQRMETAKHLVQAVVAGNLSPEPGAGEEKAGP
jgi:hypothetical protein